MNEIWKSKYPNSEDKDFDWDKLIYVFDGYTIKIGKFEWHHSSMFIHDLVGEQINWENWGVWCWKEDMDNYLWKMRE